MPTFPASRLADIAPFHVMELMARARALEAEGRNIIHMEVGEPDFPTPEPIIAAAQASIESGRVFYTPALGLPELRACNRRLLPDTLRNQHPRSTYCGDCRRLRRPAAGHGLPRRTGQRMAALRSWLPVQPQFRAQLRRYPDRHSGRPGKQLSTHARRHSKHTGPNATAGALLASPANPTGHAAMTTNWRPSRLCSPASGATDRRRDLPWADL
jgi:hypothetical protein